MQETLQFRPVLPVVVVVVLTMSLTMEIFNRNNVYCLFFVIVFCVCGGVAKFEEEPGRSLLFSF